MVTWCEVMAPATMTANERHESSMTEMLLIDIFSHLLEFMDSPSRVKLPGYRLNNKAIYSHGLSSSVME